MLQGGDKCQKVILKILYTWNKKNIEGVLCEYVYEKEENQSIGLEFGQENQISALVDRTGLFKERSSTFDNYKGIALLHQAYNFCKFDWKKIVDNNMEEVVAGYPVGFRTGKPFADKVHIARL